MSLPEGKQRTVWKFIFAILLIMAASGCAEQKVWHRPGADNSDLSSAQRDCRERVLAEMRSDSFYRRERASEDFRSGQVSGTGTDLSARARMHEAQSMNRRDDLFLDCMRSKGYSRVTRPPAS